MNVVDSSGWLEYLAGTEDGAFFTPAIQDTEKLLVPMICLYEVFKRILQQRGQEDALQAVGVLSVGRILELTGDLALRAAHYSMAYKLPMVDSMILATAREHDATLWTQEEHFEGLEGVKYIAKGAGER